MLGPLARLDDLDGPPEEEKSLRDYPDLKGLLAEAPSVVRARKSGHVQYLNVDAVVDAVTVGGETRVVEIPFGPGNFVSAGLPVARVWPARKVDLDSAGEGSVHDALLFGEERTFRQDFTFGLRQLTDIALKGLSPSVNDPTTAMQAMDRTEAILIALGGKALSPSIQKREIGEARVVVKVGYPSFDDVVELAFDQIRGAAFATAQVVFLRRFLQVIERALRANTSPELQRALWDRAFTVGYLAPHQIPAERDAVSLILRTVEVGAPLLKTERSAAVGSDLEELADLSEGLRGGEWVREAVDAAW